MKPIAVVLIAVASAIAGGIVGSFVGGAAGTIAGGAGGGALGMKAGVCAATEVAKSQKLLTSAQADQLANQSYTKLKSLVNNSNKEVMFTGDSDCQTTFNQVQQLAK